MLPAAAAVPRLQVSHGNLRFLRSPWALVGALHSPSAKSTGVSFSRVSQTDVCALSHALNTSKRNSTSQATPPLSPNPNACISAPHMGQKWATELWPVVFFGPFHSCHRCQYTCAEHGRNGSLVRSCKTPAYDNWKQDISAGKCFIPCGTA